MVNARTIEAHVRRLVGMISPTSVDHVVLKDWRRIGDVDLAAAVLGTDAFTKRIDPVEADLSGLQRVVVVAPHPDDEAIGMGGTLTRLAAQGTRIHIVVASAWDDRAEGTRLRDEAQACADELGATLTWLGVPSSDWVCSTAHLDRLDGLIGSVQADALFIPWLLDSPPSHRLTNQILAASVHRSRPHFDVSLWAYQVHNAILATSWVDITSDIDAKVDLIRKYRSQVEGGRRYDHQARGLAAWNTHLVQGRDFGYDPSSQPLFVELFFRTSLRLYCDLIAHWYAQDLVATYRGEERYVHAARRLAAL